MKKIDFSNGLMNFYSFMLLIFGVLEISIIWVMSIFFICYMASDDSEKTFFCKDNFVVNILTIVLFIAIAFFLKKKNIIANFSEKLTDDDYFKKVKSNLLKVIAVIGLLWVVITQYVPGSDQLDVMASAYKYGIGSTDMVEANGYLDRWPHNIGITTIERLLAFVVGDFNIVFMQLLNIPGIVLIYKKMVEIWDKFDGSRLNQICTLGCGVVFYPLIMYASFVYGNIWSLTFALIAFDAELDFFENQSIKNIVICAVSIGLSYMVKGSGIIFLVALVIYAIVRGPMEKIKLQKVLILFLAVGLSYIFFSVVPKIAIANVTDRELRDSDGIWSFIAMGLQEDGTAPGWYNNYCLNVYYGNDRNSEVSEQIAKEETFNRINYLFSDKHHAYQFFSKKVASMWIEPTYQGYWINQVRNHRTDFPAWLDAFMTAKGYTVGAKIFDIFLVIILTGTVLWMVLEEKTKFVIKSLFLLTVVGGYTFHLFWEIKSQYSITYFILLFPYAIAGFELLLEKGFKSMKTYNKILLGYCLAVAVLYMVGYKMDASNCLSTDNATYDRYLEIWQQPYTDETVKDINVMKYYLQQQ